MQLDDPVLQKSLLAYLNSELSSLYAVVVMQLSPVKTDWTLRCTVLPKSPNDNTLKPVELLLCITVW